MDETAPNGRSHGDQLLRRFDDWARTLALLRSRAANLPDDEGDLACARLAVITMRAYVDLLEPLLDEYPGPRGGRKPAVRPGAGPFASGSSDESASG